MNYDLALIIPFYNAQKLISRSFQNCQKLSELAKIQILYIDNVSKDDSFSILKKKIQNKKNFFLYKTAKKNLKSPGIARNLGIKYAKAPRIIFLDIDDNLDTNHIKKLITYLKKNNSNIIYLKKNIIDENKILKNNESPYVKYSKKNIKDFFIKSMNRASISIVFKKTFLLKNKIFFKKGIFEDIFFTFKAHYYDTKIKKTFPFKIYKKFIERKSITNSKITMYHLSCMYDAWNDIKNFLKKNLNPKNYNILDKFIQFRLRGEFANEYQKIVKSKNTLKTKKKYLNFAIKKYKKIIKPNFKVLTTKDKVAHRELKY